MYKIVLYLFIVLLFSCEKTETIETVKDFEYQVIIQNDDWAASRIYCDSFNMINRNEIIIYCNGNKTKNICR